MRVQAQGCAELGSPFYGSLLESAAADLEAGGPVLNVLAGFGNETEWSALALRLMGAVHRMVLQGGCRSWSLTIHRSVAMAMLQWRGPSFAKLCTSTDRRSVA